MPEIRVTMPKIVGIYKIKPDRFLCLSGFAFYLCSNRFFNHCVVFVSTEVLNTCNSFDLSDDILCKFISLFRCA